MVTQLLPLQVLTTLLLGTALVVSCVMRRHGPPWIWYLLDLSENCLAQNSMVYQPLAIYHNIPWYLHHFQTHPDTFGLFRAKCQEHHGCLVRDWQHSRLLNDFICGSPAFSRRHNETYSVNHEYPQTISLVLLLLMDWMEGTSRGKHGFYHQVRGFLQNYPERDPLIVRICYMIRLFLRLVLCSRSFSCSCGCKVSFLIAFIMPAMFWYKVQTWPRHCWKLNISRDGGFQRWSTPKSSKLLLCLYLYSIMANQ